MLDAEGGCVTNGMVDPHEFVKVTEIFNEEVTSGKDCHARRYVIGDGGFSHLLMNDWSDYLLPATVWLSEVSLK